MRAARKTEKSGEKEFFVAIRIFLAILCRLMSPAYVRIYSGGAVPDFADNSVTRRIRLCIHGSSAPC